MFEGTAIPPAGIQGNPTYVMSGFDGVEWLEIEKVKFYTDAFVLQPGKVRCSSSQRPPRNIPYVGTPGTEEKGIWPSQVRAHHCLECLIAFPTYNVQVQWIWSVTPEGTVLMWKVNNITL